MSKPILTRSSIKKEKDLTNLRLRRIKFLDSIKADIFTKAKSNHARSSLKPLKSIKYILNISIPHSLAKLKGLNKFCASGMKCIKRITYKKFNFLQDELFLDLEPFKLLSKLSPNLECLSIVHDATEYSTYNFYKSLENLNYIGSSKNPKKHWNISLADKNFWIMALKRYTVHFEMEVIQHHYVDRALLGLPPDVALSIGVTFRGSRQFEDRYATMDNWKITDLALYCRSINDIEQFNKFTEGIKDLNTLKIWIKNTSTMLDIQIEDFACLFNDNKQYTKDLKNLVLQIKDVSLTKKDFKKLQFPKSLRSLCFKIWGPIPAEETNNLMCLAHFGSNIKELTELRSLEIGIATTYYVNQMIHNMPGTLKNIEDLKLDFVELKRNAAFEEFYVNSCLEWITTMPNLKRIFVRSNRINYTYCSFLTQEEFPKNLEVMEWKDEHLSKTISYGRFSNQTWIECKKQEDLDVIFSILSSGRTQYLEIPLVFDAMSGEASLGNFVELFHRLRNLKKAVICIGFKMVDPKDIAQIEEAITRVKSLFKNRTLPFIKLYIYYRELSPDVTTDIVTIESQGNSWKGCQLHYIHNPY